MLRIGCLCPPVSGHLNPTMALARTLAERGHQVVYLGILDAVPAVSAARIEFQSIGEVEFPVGSVAERSIQLGKLKGRAALKYTLDQLRLASEVILRQTPERARDWKLDGLIVDQFSLAGGTVAECLDVPYVTLCNALMMNREVGVPPFAVDWSYRKGWLGRVRNSLGWAAIRQTMRPVLETCNEYRDRQKLPKYSSVDDGYSKVAQISQQTADFEFPRHELPTCFHFVGPLRDARARPKVEFPFDELDGRPIVYASMGTLQNQLHGIFRTITEACESLPVQLVISLGSSGSSLKSQLPDWPLVVDYAPQLELLERATLTITHAGLNTTLESLACGVPMVAIPVTNDQPAVAARIAYTGSGESVSLKKLEANSLRSVLEKVLDNPTYRQNAQRIQAGIESVSATQRAADIVEQAISTGNPVEQLSSSEDERAGCM